MIIIIIIIKICCKKQTNIESENFNKKTKIHNKICGRIPFLQKNIK